jgi:hypothetical protein
LTGEGKRAASASCSQPVVALMPVRGAAAIPSGYSVTFAATPSLLPCLLVTHLYGLYGPAARCKRDDSSAGGAAVLHQCIRPRTWSVFHPLRATMDMRAHSTSLAVMSASTIWVTRFRMRREDRSSMPCFFPLADLGGKTSATDHLHLSSVQFLCSVRVAVPSPRPACRSGRRAQGAVETGRQAIRATCADASRPRLDGAEHGRQHQAGWGA